jgi:hypothetical protein
VNSLGGTCEFICEVNLCEEKMFCGDRHRLYLVVSSLFKMGKLEIMLRSFWNRSAGIALAS